MPPANPWSIQPGVVWEFVASTKTASDHLYWGLPNGPGISLLVLAKPRGQCRREETGPFRARVKAQASSGKLDKIEYRFI